MKRFTTQEALVLELNTETRTRENTKKLTQDKQKMNWTNMRLMRKLSLMALCLGKESATTLVFLKTWGNSTLIEEEEEIWLIFGILQCIFHEYPHFFFAHTTSLQESRVNHIWWGASSRQGGICCSFMCLDSFAVPWHFHKHSEVELEWWVSTIS